MSTSVSKESFEQRVEAFKKAISDADYILMGGGAGFSTAAGVPYSGPEFEECFSDFVEKYHFTDLYSASFTEFPTQEEKWAFWCKAIQFAMLRHSNLPVYTQLFELVKDKPYFVLTTNVDGQFERAGFDPERIFATQGQYNLIQCSVPCHNSVYPIDDLVAKMLKVEKDCLVPTELVPRCPKCGKNMSMNLRADDTFVEDERWHVMSDKYDKFLREAMDGDKKIVLIEVGVGFNTPGIIRIPFERIKITNPNATLVRINKDYPEPMVEEGSERHIAFNENLDVVLNHLIKSQ